MADSPQVDVVDLLAAAARMQAANLESDARDPGVADGDERLRDAGVLEAAAGWLEGVETLTALLLYRSGNLVSVTLHPHQRAAEDALRREVVQHVDGAGDAPLADLAAEAADSVGLGAEIAPVDLGEDAAS